MSDTPRTDGQLANRGSLPVTTTVSIEFARQLERELNDLATQSINQLRHIEVVESREACLREELRNLIYR